MIARVSSAGDQRRSFAFSIVTFLAGFALSVSGTAKTWAGQQIAPEFGYIHPAGGRAGTTVNVTLGGYDWTADMQYFVVGNPAVQLKILGPRSSIIVPEPPYWFGFKARGPDFPLPREVPAQLVIPAGTPPGTIYLQAANANGVTRRCAFVISNSEEIVEHRDRNEPQRLATIPCTVSGQIKKIEEVDHYQFRAPKSGPVSLELFARRLGSKLDAIVAVTDATGKELVSVAGTEGNDLALTFAAVAGQEYTVSVYDHDYRGNRSSTYRLSLRPGPRVVGAIPPIGRRGETRQVEFLGYGIATGAPVLESVTKSVTFPTNPGEQSWSYVLETPFGTASPWSLHLDDIATQTRLPPHPGKATTLVLPTAIAAAFSDHEDCHRYVVSLKKGDQIVVTGQASEFASPVDLTLGLEDTQGKVLMTVDSSPKGAPQLKYQAVADGEFILTAREVSGKTGRKDAVYRLVAEIVPAGKGDAVPKATSANGAEILSMTVPDELAIPSGGKGEIAVTIVRAPTALEIPISLKVTGLPSGMSVPAELSIPPKMSALKIPIAYDKAAAVTASLVTVTATPVGGKKSWSEALVVAGTMKPPFQVVPESNDDVRKAPRGATYLAPVDLKRENGFQGPIVLEMTANQQRHRMGIHSADMVVPANVTKVEYPIYLPEWLETTLTSRMILNGVAEVADPAGKPRHLVVKAETRIGFLPGGALLKLAADRTEAAVRSGGEVTLPLIVSRSATLGEPVKIELIAEKQVQGLIVLDPVTVSASEERKTVRLTVDKRTPTGTHEITLRAMALQGGKHPVISEATILLDVVP